MGARPDQQRPPHRVPAGVIGRELEQAQLTLVHAGLVQPPFQARQMDVADGACVRTTEPSGSRTNKNEKGRK